MGVLSIELGRLDKALQFLQDGCAIIGRLAEADPDNNRSQHDLVACHEKIGNVQVAQGQLGSALKSYREAYAFMRRLAKADPNNTL